MKDLVSTQDFVKAAHLHRIGMAGVAKPLMKFAGLHEINSIYRNLYDQKGLDFADGFLEEMGVQLNFEGTGISKIPKEGPFVTVSNHPYGLLDGIILLKLFTEIRPDFKIMAHFILKQMEPVADRFIPVNPLEQSTAYSSFAGMKHAWSHLREGHPLGIFPAGEVSTYHKSEKKVCDRDWQLPALKLIKRAEVPIIPVYFSGTNSMLFHLLGMIHPTLRTVAIPSETLKKKNSEVTVRVGSPIHPKELKSLQEPTEMGKYLRARTYALGTGFKTQTPIKPLPIKLNNKKPVDLADSQPISEIELEIDALRELHRVVDHKPFEVFVAPAEKCPKILKELGRLRELCFREVGEGTNQALDLDEFDSYYQHLILWDREASRIVGAYRLGLGDQIMRYFGREGFYSSTLFTIQGGLDYILRESVELGRSFIISEYQRKRLPLFLLWKGIYEFLTLNPQFRYLIGPVSISQDYSPLSRALMVELTQRHYFDPELAQFVQAKNPYKKQRKFGDEVDTLMAGITNDLKQIDKLLDDIEQGAARLPVLLKKYIHQNAKIIGFNVDPAFNNSLDGFTVLDLRQLPDSTNEQMNKSLK
ncbi:GNAT family N-acyltransferase [Pontibacter sp. G13]|uniref:lysophospholipid acyltransferase family protein n=1 Tax=Pontibacter sp. G13 TaxID=3074898 RepID=UPI00288AB96C|nr:GNAT family N-acyltransferase [Pontibacter sp. G13]WNJ16956.1 GNAT family N-acyltransferase [Pontibacter sp. G13]